jgi:hypothetical protein
VAKQSPASATPFFSSRCGYARNTKVVEASPVLCLFTLGRPAAIIREIPQIIVGPIKRVFGVWTTSHIGEKVGVIIPTLADRNASATIVFPVFAGFVLASLMHRVPRGPFWSFVGFAMGARSFGSLFSTKTTTRLSASIAKVATYSGRLSPAIAKAIPRLFVGVVSERNQATETLARDVDEVRHGGSIAQLSPQSI